MAGADLSRVLVTGALGFVGGELARALIADGRDVTLLVREGKKKEAEEKFVGFRETVTLQDLLEFPDARVFETIFHLATVYIYENTIADIPRLIDSNITLPTTLADIASRWGTKVFFVNASTFMQHFQGASYSPTCLYAATKKSIEDILDYYNSAFEGLNIAHIVFPHIYGEGDTRAKLLNLIINATKSKSSLSLASGRQLLDLVHVSDAITALKHVETLGAGRWSIGSEVCYSIKELIELVHEISQIGLEVNFDEVKDRRYDTFQIWETAERLPGWTEGTHLREWIKKQLVISEEIR